VNTTPRAESSSKVFWQSSVPITPARALRDERADLFRGVPVVAHSDGGEDDLHGGPAGWADGQPPEARPRAFEPRAHGDVAADLEPELLA
jgi:hypothetical protein